MSRAKGDKAEEKALSFLQQKGFRIIEHNFYSRFGEIDIIALRDGIMHFIEVKSANNFEVAIANITSTKLSKIIKTADVYMKKTAYDGEYSFDAVIVVGEDIELIENITL